MVESEYTIKGRPVISVIIPVYNGEKYIEHCVTRIEEINHDIRGCFEIIVVDDGSEDNSISIINSLLSQFDNIVIVSKSNGGIASARNAGLLKAAGKYVAFCDQDDSVCKGLSTFIQKLEKSQSDFIITNYEISDGRKGEFFSSPEICGREKERGHVETIDMASSFFWGLRVYSQSSQSSSPS